MFERDAVAVATGGDGGSTGSASVLLVTWPSGERSKTAGERGRDDPGEPDTASSFVVDADGPGRCGTRAKCCVAMRDTSRAWLDDDNVGPGLQVADAMVM